jgi:hypothetical protein
MIRPLARCERDVFRWEIFLGTSEGCPEERFT